MVQVEGTGCWAYSVIYCELCGLWTELKEQRAGNIVVYRMNSVGYCAS